jgi:hypothetical protein
VYSFFIVEEKDKEVTPSAAGAPQRTASTRYFQAESDYYSLFINLIMHEFGNLLEDKFAGLAHGPGAIDVLFQLLFWPALAGSGRWALGARRDAGELAWVGEGSKAARKPTGYARSQKRPGRVGQGRLVEGR